MIKVTNHSGFRVNLDKDASKVVNEVKNNTISTELKNDFLKNFKKLNKNNKIFK